MRIVVIGAGVLGSLYGARLAAAGHSVTVVARGSRLTELQRGPIVISNDEDGMRCRLQDRHGVKHVVSDSQKPTRLQLFDRIRC